MGFGSGEPKMANVDHRYRHDPGRAPRDGEHRTPKSNVDHREGYRDLDRRGERLESGDKSRTRQPTGHERRPPEGRHAQDRPREERPRDGKEASRDRHRGDRGLDSEMESRNREDRSRQQGRMEDVPLERREGSRDRPRDERSRDRGERSHYRHEGAQDRYWEERSHGTYQEKPRSRESDRYWDERGQSFPRDERELDFHQESAYYKKDALSLGYGPPPQSPTFDERDCESVAGGGILECNKCRYLCTGRGVLQILEIVLCALVLICVVSSYFALSGLSASFASGSFGNNYFPFEGQELQQVRQLDQQFTVMRSPLVYGGLAFSLLMGSMTLGILAVGSKHRQDLTKKWLLLEAAFSVLASLCCGAAVGIFLHFALEINATDVCKKRERLYARNGLSWMNCDLAGTDGAAATFAIILIIFYMASVVLAIRSLREQTRDRGYPDGSSAGIEPDFPNRY
ncbi:MARVEL domain-containing protein 3 isoform X1 [Pleurodeles waltl]|uniref:MARVEL domain-containing protein 3 isoform X1 n=2 Tax=Pleurodeles waltl TaxID=8319 RepID=UPI0037095DCC